MRVVLTLAVTMLACLAAFAQQGPEALPEEQDEESFEPVRRYTVELIVFAYGESVSGGNEIWLPGEPVIGTGPGATAERVFSERRFGFFGADEPIPELEPPAVTYRYMEPGRVPLDPYEYTMNEIYDKLVELDAYEPMMRAGWTQPTFEKQVTAPTDLRLFGELPPGLEGHLILYRGRFLHLVVDLTLNADRLPSHSSRTGDSILGDSRVQNEYGVVYEFGRPPPIRYRIFEDRIMKNGDVRYFDHPKFGVIVKVTRFEEPEEEIFDDTDDLLPGSALSP